MNQSNTMEPVTIIVRGLDSLPVGSTVRIEVEIELGPSSTVSNSTMTVNHGATLTAETEIVTDDDDAAVQP